MTLGQTHTLSLTLLHKVVVAGIMWKREECRKALLSPHWGEKRGTNEVNKIL